MFHALAGSRSVKSLVSSYGLRPRHGFARRFVAGETAADAIAAARQIEAAGLAQTLDYLGPGTATIREADAATRTLIGLLDELAASRIERNLSLKLTQFGVRVDRATCVDNLRRILDPATAGGFFVRIDMEDSRYTQVTLDVFETLWQQGYRNAGMVVQACLPRSVADARRLVALGARVRLVKGGYDEPRRTAFRSRAQVNRAFVTLMELLLSEGSYPAIATHDAVLIEATRKFAASRGIQPDRYEFQMLYGVRRDLQRSLAAQGCRLRVYIPFGSEWFSYLMSHLGRHPADLRFVLRNVLTSR